jgi:hypothetical protein
MSQFIRAQVNTDTYKSYMYTIDNQFDNVQISNYNFNFGMARRFVLQFPIEAGGSLESMSLNSNAMESANNTINLNTVNYGRKIQLGYDTWDGVKLGGGYHSVSSNKHNVNAYALAYGDNRINTLENRKIKNQVQGAMVRTNYNYNHKKTEFGSYVMAKSDERKYELEQGNGLDINQQLIAWNNTFSYKATVNSTLRAYSSVSLYQGDFSANLFRYEGSQQYFSLGAEYEFVRPNWFVQNRINLQRIQDVQVFATSQNQIALNNVVQTTVKGLDTKLRLRNSLIYSERRLFYAPALSAVYEKDELRLFADAERTVHTQANAFERYPSYIMSYSGIKNIVRDKYDFRFFYKLPKEYAIKGALSYTHFQNYAVENRGFLRSVSLDGIARANITADKRWGSNTTISASYNYRFAGAGELANLAPTHIGFAEIKNNHIRSEYIGDIIGKELYWGFDLAAGYRGKAGNIVDLGWLGYDIVPDALEGQFFVDFSYRLTNDYYRYNRTSLPLSFVFSVRNLFAKDALNSDYQNNTMLLLSEGLRAARSFNFTVEYTFHNY